MSSPCVVSYSQHTVDAASLKPDICLRDTISARHKCGMTLINAIKAYIEDSILDEMCFTTTSAR